MKRFKQLSLQEPTFERVESRFHFLSEQRNSKTRRRLISPFFKSIQMSAIMVEAKQNYFGTVLQQTYFLDMFWRNSTSWKYIKFLTKRQHITDFHLLSCVVSMLIKHIWHKKKASFEAIILISTETKATELRRIWYKQNGSVLNFRHFLK